MLVKMKRFLVLLLIFFVLPSVSAEEIYRLDFQGEQYNLIYSQKSSEHNGYFNGYFKQGEDINSWTDMIAVHHFPNVFSPIETAHNFKEYLAQLRCPCAISEDEENNRSMIDCLVIDSEELPIVLEFNVFKYEKHPECGTIAFQYVKKYSVDNVLQVEKVKKDFEKYRPRIIKQVLKYEMPELVKVDIGEIKLNDLP